MNTFAFILALVLSTATGVRLAQLEHSQSEHQHNHHAEVDKRGDMAMGFSHEKSTHHFRVKTNGGAIEVTANDAADETTIKQIRSHLGHIAKMFAEGNFSAPMFIHDRTPPGVETMKRLKSEIKYEYSDLPAGGRVTISTANSEAVASIHEFLRFQISDHRTGDTTEIEPK
jgi:hypothetical protein